MRKEYGDSSVCVFKLFESVLLFLRAGIENSSNSGSGGMIKVNMVPQVHWLFKIKFNHRQAIKK